MAVIFTAIVVLINLLFFFVARNKASKRELVQIRSSLSNLQYRLAAIQVELNRDVNHSVLETTSVPSLSQSLGTSGDISILQTEISNIRRELQATSKTLSAHSQAIESIKERQFDLRSTASAAPHTPQQRLNPITELNSSSQGSNPFPLPGIFAGLEYEQPVHTAEAASSSNSQSPPLSQPEPFEQVSQYYQDAISRGDRQALRQMQFKELNITSESEDLLLRGNCSQVTKLEAVLGGGSYMVVCSEGQYWLFPTAQTLDSFKMNQPQKGIFSYEREVLSKPLVKRPAEVREEGEDWIVSAQGIISVPG
jgi:hypothetical protein